MIEISGNGQLVLGAYALADTHTMTAEQIVELSSGALDLASVRASLSELIRLEHAEASGQGGYRLTRTGIEFTLRLQAALAARQK